MKKNLGVVQAVYPMPVLIVAAYDENGKVNAMNAAWGMICSSDRTLIPLADSCFAEGRMIRYLFSKLKATKPTINNVWLNFLDKSAF